MIIALILLFIISTASAQIHNATQILPIVDLGAEDLQVAFNNYSEYPDITKDQQGNIWIAYTELSNRKENIILKKITNLKIVDSVVVNSSSEGNEYYPRLFCDKENKIWITWSAKRNNNWDIVKIQI